MIRTVDLRVAVAALAIHHHEAHLLSGHRLVPARFVAFLA
jgi:hypothetical protein